MINNLYVAWQDQATREWHTVARLRRLDSGYEFGFTHGVERLRSAPFDLFRMDVNKRYSSQDLMPLFKNKLPSRNRSDFIKLVNWLNLRGNEGEFESLSKFGLIPGTDSILVYPEPDVTAGNYSIEFFVHGIRHMHRDALTVCRDLREGGRLLPLLDVQNPVDANAVALRCESDPLLIGYVPAFYATDLRLILSDVNLSHEARITVVRNNDDAPVQMRLLCRFDAVVSRSFQAFSASVYKPIFEEIAA